MDVQEEDASFVHRTRRTEDRGDPLVQVVSLGSSAASGIVRQEARQRIRRQVPAVGWRIESDLRKFLLDPVRV